jgi:hypothetical protein
VAEEENLEAPATYKLPPMPTPPIACRAPVVVLIAAAVPTTVIAVPAEIPTAANVPLAGFIWMVFTVDNPKPVPDAADITVG